MKKTSLRRRLLVHLSIALCSLLVISNILSFWLVRESTNIPYDRNLLAIARTIGQNIELSLDNKLQLKVPYLALDAFNYDNSGRLYYQVLDSQQNTIAGFDQLPGPEANTPRTDIYPALAKFYDASYKDQAVRVASFLQPVADQMVEIRVAETDDARIVFSTTLVFYNTLRFLLVLLLILLVVWLAVSKALLPLYRLSLFFQQSKTAPIHNIAPNITDKELLPLVEALNSYTRRLHKQMRQQANFLNDTAHQLRTPLAVLQSHLQLGLLSQTITEKQQSLEHALKQTTHLTQLTNQLLSLARLQHNQQNAKQQPKQAFLLNTIAQEACQHFALLMHNASVQLNFEPLATLQLNGYPHLIRELLYCLLDNTLQHAQASTVTVRLLHNATLQIEDDGIGIHHDLHKRVFKRFYRLNNAVQGSGLGLSIAYSICRLHNANIQLSQGAMQGLCITIVFPWSNNSSTNETTAQP
ncbi:sensor histidine kinase [Pseudomonas sp. F1_0610]|uniref:sensor histidine kinase n=1 Tax=Pseudomonas sp. F1_0610 TaxID=3114284 RepID=UPI0039C0719F